MAETTGFRIQFDHGNILNSLEKLSKIILPCDEMRLTKMLRLWETNQLELEKLVNFLSQLIVHPKYTIAIKSNFRNILFLIVTKRFSLEVKTVSLGVHQEECVCLSKLIDHSVHVANHALQYFKLNPSPFSFDEGKESKPKLKKRDNRVSSLDIVKCCYSFLKTDYNFYKNAWKWSEFLKIFRNKGCDLQKLYCNYIIALLTGMSEHQLNTINKNLPKTLILKNQIEIHKFESHHVNDENSPTNTVTSTFRSDVVCCIEDVILPIHDVSNKKFYQNHDVGEKIVDVSSTKINMRSIALGISSEKAICLAGPVGCGKTTLTEHLAKLTGRIAPNSQIDEITPTTSHEAQMQEAANSSKKSLKRTSSQDKQESSGGRSNMSNNGFLRIQLGDQTDSKMLLGQYRCTDVPGEFVWQPGVLTQAVINGQWLLLEDIDCATQDVTTVLTSLLENRYLSVPGFRDCVRVAPGFQLFVTLRSQKLTNHAQQSNFQILEKYLYIINMLPLSRSELCSIISTNYPKLSTIADRIVDVYLQFSKGMHQQETEQSSDSMDISSNQLTEKVTLAGLSNANRLVSTRDLFKLCKRSHPTFSVTSTECAFNVFQNAVDLFCSYLPHGIAKTQLIINIGAKLGIIQSRCEFYSDEYKPEVLITGVDIKCGRVQVTRRLNILNADKCVEKKRNADDQGGSVPQKKKKVDKTSYLNVYQESKRKAPTFSFTRLAACVLEKIAVAVVHNEPVLLVGETGVGKTSSVQYLAHQTNHKLVVVNMNNQSDVSDLIGGYKPVDLGFVLTPLRSEFEFLFKKTFVSSKNEKFLNNLSICFNRSNFTMIIKLMLKVCDTVFNKKSEMNLQSVKSSVILSRWSALQVKLLRLNSQLKHSINISFAFIPGSLVNCIKNGDWVLLDEINLASTETLECLSTILEPDGSIVLLEKGDYVPIQRHADFRIFACMNPSTDVGKKDLPVGIRNRFSEFFVDELTTENDLMILVGDYLNSSGIQKTKVFEIVKLYRKLRTLAQLDLNDGLGNRPVYSLRTLCRSLSICAKNLCGSIERNLYESFCVSFLTQLDQPSHKIVELLIQQALISNAKAILNKQIPRPIAECIDFEGYWIQTGPRDVLECKDYILTASVKQNLKDLSRIISIGRLPVLLQGPTSAGKTSLIEYVAKRSGNFCLRINNHEHTDLQEYIGTYTSDVSGKLSFKEGVLVQAMRNGYWIILDELNLAPSDILEALNRVLDDNRELYIPETQTLVKAHPSFMLFATQNPPGLYGGRKMLSRAFKNRFIELHFSEIPKVELEVILEKRCLIPKSYAQKMVKTMSELQINRKRTSKGSFTLRDLFRWGNRYTYANPQLMENKTYDWNQHLVDEGFLVLSSKIRNDVEVDIIEESLFKHFRKKIDLEKLFVLNDETSMVTRDILDKLEKQINFQNIVWTFNMKRMAVLVAKGVEFNEPILLVGPTGCGKTTVCQILANINEMDLKILNCHMHTEGADFLGGLRPFRSEENHEKQMVKKQLFEWANGPLVTSMLDGTYFLADEISLAEDSVLERLNCILEPERTLLLSEKGGANENIISSSNDAAEEFVIKAKTSFKFFATMNPGGDFGKKELSPALRNRFTEIWCRATESREDFIKIAAHTFKINFNCLTDPSADMLINDIATVIVNSVYYLKQLVDKLNFSIRDILAWVGFITANSHITEVKALTVYESLYFGLQTFFLDSLEMLPYETYNEIEIIRTKAIKYLIAQIREHLQKSLKLEDIQAKRGSFVENSDQRFGINPFFIPVSVNGSTIPTDFMFTAPTTQQNLFRLLSALSLNKAILLEGPPGVGKTSLIENLTTSIGFNIVRINLCEHTDLADLFGTDLPAENKNYDNKIDGTESSLGSFVWRDGPLLSALKAENTWILLDELNLAPQSVLEGLNAILDHRGEVFIPELNKTFKLGGKTRIFASQNPLRQGGGRKGLPQSFLNRFTKVYLRKLATNDLLHVVNGKYAKYFKQLAEYFKVDIDYSDDDDKLSLFDIELSAMPNEGIKFDLANRLVMFSEQLDEGITNLEFGYKGGPFEVNLRDILRWCELLSNEKTGFSFSQMDLDIAESFNDFKLIMFEKMKLVYDLRMRTESDKAFIRTKFAQVFNCDVDLLQKISQDISLYWNDDTVYLNDIEIRKEQLNESLSMGDELELPKMNNRAPLLLTSQLEVIKNLAECSINSKPTILCGSTDCGKTKTIDVLCTMLNRNCVMDTIDDSVTGSFQQVDLYRHLEEIAKQIETILVRKLQQIAVESNASSFTKFLKLLDLWETYVLSLENVETSTPAATSVELIVFKKRQQHLVNLFSYLLSIHDDASCSQMELLSKKLKALNSIVENTVTLNTGGHFEWVDSKIVKSLKYGQYICLEHVNLCSSAILDRLNPIFEPNGSLLISEKGVSDDNEPDIVTKHKNFNAFLTLDPKNGEISRAMRNRCIEINLIKENYSHDDLKRLVYVNGVKDMCLIDCLLNLHKRLSSVSDFNAFGISHILKCAFLVAENKRQGCSNLVSIQNSAFEVYVRSSNTDLLGFGLEFYRKKLETEILEEIQCMKSTDNLINYDNIVLRSSELNTLSLIRLQCEAFLSMVRCYEQNHQSMDVLSSGFSEFPTMPLDVDFASLCYMLFVIYDISSFADAERRKIYLEMSLSSSSPLRKMLQEINNKLYQVIIATRSTKTESNEQVPWNSKVFPRLRLYQHNRLSTSDQLKITAELITKILTKYVITKDSIKLKQIDVITYSKAVQAGTIQDSLRNDFVSYVYPLLKNLPEFVRIYLTNASMITDKSFTQLICSFLWSDRVYKMTTHQLLKDKQLNENMLDKLVLHFGWLKKHLIDPLFKCCEDETVSVQAFEKPCLKMSSYAETNWHPLNQVRKEYVKRYTNSMPYYEEHQIMFHDCVREFSNLVNLVPHIGQFDKDEMMKKIKIIFNDATTKMREFLVQHSCDGLEWFSTTVEGTDDNLDLNSNSIEATQSLVKTIQEKKTFFECIHDTTEVDTIALRKLNDLLPIAEYFAMKSLTSVLNGRSDERPVNLQFFNQINTINIDLWQLLKAITNDKYKICEAIWNESLRELSPDNENIISKLPTDFYKNFSSFQRTIISQVHSFSMNSICVQNEILKPSEIGTVEHCSYNRPNLTLTALNALFDQQGNFKSSGLGEAEIWRNTLSSLSKLIWYNINICSNDFSLEAANLKSSMSHTNKLVTELHWIKDKFSHENQEFFNDFMATIEYLKRKQNEYNSKELKMTNSIDVRFAQHYRSSILNVLIGSIEINLLTFMPIIDPVEKNRLKKMYNDEDANHIQQILTAYSASKVVMNYQNLGEEMLNHLRVKLTEIKKRREKFSKKVALRPNECLYGDLVRDVNHFLRTCCHPETLNSLVESVEEALTFKMDYTTADGNITNTIEHLRNVTEIIKKIDLWINNAQQFKHHTLTKYSAFYRDFLTPVENSITTLNFGFVGLQSCLIRSRDSICLRSNGTYFDINNNDEFAGLFSHLIEFPNAKELDVLPSHASSSSTQKLNITTVMNQLPNYEECYFKLIKSKLYEVRNKIEISTSISDVSFSKYDSILNICNMIWMEQEETKRKKLAEEESLYVHKTHCETEDEEQVILEEIEKMFPTDVDNDFGEFIQNVTLEKIVKKPNPRKTNKSTDVLSNDDMKLLCTSFVDIMQKFSRCYYYTPKTSGSTPKSKLDYITSYKINTTVFNQLLQRYKTCLNTKIDETVYGGLGLVIGISQQNYDILQLTDKFESVYDFYRDSNIPEIMNSTEVLRKIEIRANEELEVWPDHAGLQDMHRIIQRIRSLPLTSSVVRFSTGFQLLRQKLDEWNKLAHKNNHMKDLEIEVAQHIQRWTKLELQFWRECLTQSYDKMQYKGCKYWFFIYNLIHEYLRDPVEQFASCDLTDIKSIEKCFGTDEVINEPEMKTNKRLKSGDVIGVLKQFIESSNFAEFSLRMSLLKSFEQYLHYINTPTKRRDTLIKIFHNLCLYYEQFRVRITERIKAIRTPIEKKLKEFVKIESYNKDLSYFSMRNNIARVHRNLHKFLKEFETLLNDKISLVFQLKDNLNMELTIENEKEKDSENNLTHYIVDVKYFLASPKLHEGIVIDPSIDLSNTVLLSRISKLFGTSRNIVKQAILHSHFPTLIYKLDSLLTDHIESCDYLRKLEVDRSQIKTKQKVQAKQILTQKRKALSDLYKVLSQLGLNFRTGLMESSLREEIVDLKIQPFCIRTMIFDARHKKIDQHFNYLINNLDSYYAKCVFKLKLLQTVLLTPHADLGLQNTERIKGFTIDLYLMIQEQRKNVSGMVKIVNDLQQQINKVTEIRSCDSGDVIHQDVSKCYYVIQQFKHFQGSLVKICNVFHQYVILLKCVPADADTNYNVLAEHNSFCQSSGKYMRIKEKALTILNKATILLADINQNNLSTFHSSDTISSVTEKFNLILNDVAEFSTEFKSERNESLVIGSAISDLLDQIEESNQNALNYSISHLESDLVDAETIDSELENITHSILISMQSIYKKYAVKADNLYDTRDATGQSENIADKITENESKQNDEFIEENHLKNKINSELASDLEILNVSKVTTKLTNILLTIQYGRCREVLKTMRKLVSLLPILEQYNLFCKFYLIQQIGAHKVSTKMLSVMLTVFVELGAKGFCIPPDLMEDEDGDSKQNENKGGEGFGLEDGTGENDVSDKIESEDQLDTAKKPGDEKESKDEEDASCKEEHGIDMSEDFDSKLQDVEKTGDDSDESDQSDNDEEADKQMGETEEGAEQLDDQIWGSDEEKEEPDENDLKEDENGKGSNDDNDNHNDLDANKNDDKQQGDEKQEGLDAADNGEEKKKQQKDIDKLADPEVGEDQINPYHNELEDPPEPEDLDLGDNFNLDKEDGNDNEETNEENPFDIDTMKDNMEADEDPNNEEEPEASDAKDQAEQDDDSDSESDTEDATKKTGDEGEDIEKSEHEDNEENTETPGKSEEDAEKDDHTDEKDDKMNQNNDYNESKDKASHEDNIQATPDEKPKGSSDQVQIEQSDKQQKQDDEMDAQDTGEDKQGTGQAENEESKSGHQGYADSKETKSNEKQPKEKKLQEKRKHGNTNEERTVSDTKQKDEKKLLKTIDKLNEKEGHDSGDEENDPEDADEYQHIKDAKKTDKTTLDNATDEQSKQVYHQDNVEDEETGLDDGKDDLMETDENEEHDEDKVDEMQSEPTESKSKKPSKERCNDDKCETEEVIEVEGETVLTHSVQRSDETSAHCLVDILHDASLPTEVSALESFEMRKLVEKERFNRRMVHPEHEDFETWQTISNKMLPNARELCEQLRLILEPTKCTRLRGDYRTGRRINMKKIIPYIASQFRKDKIWLRRTKAAQRDYKITIAIDDSKSMHHNNSKNLTLMAISLVSQALKFLESGSLSILSFGEEPRIILNHSEQFDGPKLVNSLNFNQNKSKIGQLLDFTRTACSEITGSGSDNGIFENLLLILSDGRNIFSEGEKYVRNSVKLARLNRIFIVYIIIDNPDNKHSILDIRGSSFSSDGKLVLNSYLDSFPFPYYVIVRELSQLPLVLSDAMRQWFELVNSEQ